ncbi:thiol reductant ABC exporter subunit CydD [Moorella sp. Hama-1]|uniref:thiol reductant ABC exporter subunit CydD n=1 Tax=Moorella sp. Hama-1 TaxID=2138101 RepID=UPI000D659687|nr:thiol reductant ABC exporter subunit CydD [Moorella sp. Hama-1]BCV22645.1 thiol reductant ABC exporter subunit CydD [Moorella sp. Hama-1]
MLLERNLLGEARRVRLHLALTVGLGLGTGLLTILQAGYLARVINAVFLGGQGLDSVRPWLLSLPLVFCLRAVLVWGGRVTAHRAAARVKYDLRQRLASHLLALGPVPLKSEHTGELVNVLTEGVEALEGYFAGYLPQLARAALLPLLILAFVFPRDLTSGLILLGTAPLIPLFMFLIGQRAEAMSQQQWATLGRLSGHFLDVLQGLTTLKIFNRSRDQIKILARVSDRFRDTTLGVLRVAFLSALVLELVATLSTALVAVTIGLRLVYNRMPFEQALFLLLLAPEFYLPLRLLGSRFHAGLDGVTAARRIFAILDQPLPAAVSSVAGPGLEDGDENGKIAFTGHPPYSPHGRNTPGPVVPTKDHNYLPRQSGLHLALQDVYYSYDRGSREALTGVSLELHPGEKVALVGPSGAGKSTIANLLLRFSEPDRGTILVNGIPLSQIPPQEWRRQVALVPQHPHLFHGSIADNLLVARPDASREELIAAAEQAGAHKFITRLPLGYDTPIGERGSRLSGGQRQRLAIARAFLKDAPLLVLDEATANLDPATDRVIQAALERLMVGRTALIITHRLTTIYRADRILVLAGGRVIEAGRHEELIARQGLYYRLVEAFNDPVATRSGDFAASREPATGVAK